MTRTISGGCLCGAIRYAYEGEIGSAGYCHCADCRRVSRSAFGVSLSVSSAGFRVTAGTPKAFTKPGDSGRLVTRYFCADFGSPLFTQPPLHPERLFIKAGSLDDPAIVRPVRQAWARSRVAWAEIDPEIESYETSRGG